jgi:hypothetical protein
MKLKWLIIVIAPLFVSGCFSSMQEQGAAWSGSNPTASQKVAAVTLDVVTFPVQAPFLIAIAGDSSGTRSPSKKEMEIAQRDAIEYKRKMSLLENNPEIAFNERWDHKASSYQRVFQDSFSNPNVKYSVETLEEIYQYISRAPGLQDYIYCSRSCSKEFLARHFDEERQRSRNISYTGLANLVSNPNTPLDLVEKVAASGTIPVGAVYPARKILSQRKSEQLSQPKTNAPSVSL